MGEDGEDVCGGRAIKRTTTTLHDGVLPHKSPLYPNYVTFNSRRESFTTWPLQLTQSPDQLASAGFFYTGCGDKVRCFSGGCGLEKWEPGDDPVLEHKKWYPDCFFVMMKTTVSDTSSVRRETLIEEKSDLDLIDPVCKICLTETAQVVVYTNNLT